MASIANLADDGGFPAMVSPLTGRAMAAEVPRDGPRKPVDAANLRDRLSRVDARTSERDQTAE